MKKNATKQPQQLERKLADGSTLTFRRKTANGIEAVHSWATGFQVLILSRW